MRKINADIHWFRDSRIGLFCHYGLYSMLERGEWVMNRESIPPDEYAKLAGRFRASRFDADALTGLAVELGAKYVTFTTKHHEGFCLFDSKLTDYTSVRSGPRRDLVREVVESCRRRGLKIALYFSLNDWHHQPDAVAALEDYRGSGVGGRRYQAFIGYVHGQIRELMTQYGRIDVMWYDGWWPFGPDGWQAQKMNRMVRRLQPHILINNRNGLPGDFSTPEQNFATIPGRVWEACFTLNDHWGFFKNDENWKSPRALIDMIVKAAKSRGNILINVGPRGDGSLPRRSVEILREVGRWVRRNEEALRPEMLQPEMDWNHYCSHGWTAREGVTYCHVTAWPAKGSMVVSGISGKVTRARLLGGGDIGFRQQGERLELLALPKTAPGRHVWVLALEHARPLRGYQTGGMRVPEVPHCRYDPTPHL